MVMKKFNYGNYMDDFYNTDFISDYETAAFQEHIFQIQ